MRRRRRLRPAIVLVAVGLAAWLLLVAFNLTAAWSSARHGLDLLDQVRTEASPSSLRTGPEVARLGDAEARFEDARSRLRSLPVSPLRALPVLGRQLRSADHLSQAAAEVAATGAEALGRVRQRLEGGLPQGPDRARLFHDLAVVAAEAQERLQGVDLGPTELVGPLAEGRARAEEELGELRGTLSRARDATAGLGELFGRDSTQLLLLGNNAEMRAGSGMFLTVGTLTIDDGALSVGEIVPTFDFQLPEPVAVEGDLSDRWGWLEPGREWRNLGVSPRFDVTAPLAARMWTAARGQEVEGVLALDVLALQALLAAVGPIDVEGEQLRADNVVDDLLHDQYLGLDAGDPASQAERRGRLGEVARATLQRLEATGVEAARLAEELAGAAQGRHILAWSSRAPVQEAWEALAVDGALGPHDLLVSVLNRGGNKLDPYLHVEAELGVEEEPGRTAVNVELRLENQAAGDQPPYILGPTPPLEVPAGTYVGLVTVTLPGAAATGRFDGVDALAVAGADGPTRVVATPVEIPLGEERILTLRFELPAAAERIDVLPSARVPPVSWRWGDQAWEDETARVVMW